MKTPASLLTALAALCSIGAAGAAETAPQLSQAAVQNAFQLLRSEYIRANELDHGTMGRAALSGLLQRLDLGAALIRKSDAQRPTVPSGVVAEKILPDIAYERPQSFSAEEAETLVEHLRALAEQGITRLILDLRSPAMPGDFEVAARILEAFVPEGEIMFKLNQAGGGQPQLFISHARPVWPHPVVLLTDEDCCNLAETIAAVLRHRQRAIIVGSGTRGATVRFETRPLDDVWLIRYARAEAQLEDGTSFFGRGITPDLPISLPPGAKRELFAEKQPAPLKESVFDTARPRYNEAALVARKNPELEDFIRRSSGAAEPTTPSKAQDTVLQRAVDMLLTRSLLDASKLEWSTSPTEAQATTVRKATRAP